MANARASVTAARVRTLMSKGLARVGSARTHTRVRPREPAGRAAKGRSRAVFPSAPLAAKNDLGRRRRAGLRVHGLPRYRLGSPSLSRTSRSRCAASSWLAASQRSTTPSDFRPPDTRHTLPARLQRNASADSSRAVACRPSGSPWSWAALIDARAAGRGSAIHRSASSRLCPGAQWGRG